MRSLRDKIQELAQTTRRLEERIAYSSRRDDAIVDELRASHDRSVRLTEWAHQHGGEDMPMPLPLSIPPFLDCNEEPPPTDLGFCMYLYCTICYEYI